MREIIQALWSLGCGLHEGLLQSTNLWERVSPLAPLPSTALRRNDISSGLEASTISHATQSKGRAFGARGWAQVYVSRPRLPETCHESTCRASWCPGLGNLHWHSTPAQAEVLRNLPTTDRMFASRCGDNHEGAPSHGRHRHGKWGSSASCGNIACDTWTCLACTFHLVSWTGCWTSWTTLWWMSVTMSRQGLRSAWRIATECGWMTEHGRGRA